MSWFTDEDEEVTVIGGPQARAEIVKAEGKELSEREKRLQSLVEIEDEILQESSLVIRDALRFRDIEPDATEPPPEWVEKHGEEEAAKMLRMAKLAHINAKNAPVGFSIAKATMVGITKARASEGAQKRQLNIGISIVMPSPQFEVIDVEGE